MQVNSVGGNSEFPPENSGNVEITTSYSKSIFSFKDKNGIVDYGDLDWEKNYDAENKTYQDIQNFLEKHNGENWTSDLITKFTKLINRYNNQAEKDAEIGIHTTETNGDETKTVSEYYDKKGRKTETIITREDSTGYDIEKRDKDNNLKSQIRTRTLEDGTVVTEKIYVDENGNLKIEEM